MTAINTMPTPGWRPRRNRKLFGRRRRNHMTALNDHMLRDLGMNRDAAQREGLQSLWGAPPHWLEKH